MIDDTIDRHIIGLLQGDLPLQSHPFQDLAQALGISEQEIVARVQALEKGAFCGGGGQYCATGRPAM